MSERMTNILGFATLIGVLALIWILFGEEQAGPTDNAALLYPQLADQITEADQIVLTEPGMTTSLIRREGSWLVQERDDYPANSDKLRALVLSLTQTKRLDPKTRNPELFDRIGLGLNAKGLSIAAQGTSIAELDVGDRKQGASGAESFVRRRDEAQSWLVSGLDPVSADPAGWIDTSLLEISRPRLASVTIRHSDGETIRLERTDPTDAFGLVDLDEEKEKLSSPTATDRPVNAPLFLSMNDVRRLGDTPASVVTTYQTFDGLVLSLSLWQEVDDWWAHITAAYDVSLPQSESAPQVMADAPASGEAEAADLSSRFQGWAYKLPAFKANAMTVRRADLVDVRADGDAGDEVADPTP